MVLDLLRHRRSIRKFKADRIEAEKIDLLLEAVLRAPSSRGRKPWQFVIVDEPLLLAELAHAKAHGAEFLAGAPLAVAVCAEPARCDVWIEDCAIAAILLQLAALLALPPAWSVLCIVGIGYPRRRLAGHPREALPAGKLHRSGCGR